MSGIHHIVRSSGVQIWQTQLASTIRSGLYDQAVVNEHNGLYVVQGRYKSGSCGAVVAKYQSEARAMDAATVVNRLAVMDPQSN